MIIRDIVFTFFFLLILYGCKNDDVPMYFRSMQPSGGKLFKGSIKDYYINSLPQNLYIGSKDYAIDSTYSAEQKEYEMVKSIVRNVNSSTKDKFRVEKKGRKPINGFVLYC